LCFFFFQAEDGIRDFHVTGVQTCALPIFSENRPLSCACLLREAAPSPEPAHFPASWPSRGPCSASRRRRSSVRFSRGRRRAVRRPGELHVHALLLQVAGEFLEALLTPEAAVLPAAERRAEVVRGAFVDPHVAHFEPVGDGERRADVVGPHAGGQSEFGVVRDRKSTRLNSSHVKISYAVFCLKKKNHTM